MGHGTQSRSGSKITPLSNEVKERVAYSTIRTVGSAASSVRRPIPIAPWAPTHRLLCVSSACKRVLTATRLDRQRGVLTAYTGGVLMLISDVLRVKGRKVVKAAASDSVRDAVHSLAENRIGAVVVEDQWMHLAGVFSERDFINAVASNGAAALELRVRDLMSAPIISCRSSDRIDAVLATMTLRKIRHVPVIDGEQLSGIVSIGDLVKHRLDEKELEANVLLDITRMRG